MKESTIQGLIDALNSIANSTKDPSVKDICHEAIARAEADKTITAELPEPLMVAIHLYMLAAHALARATSEQPKEIKGFSPKHILDGAIEEAAKAFDELSPERQHEVLLISANKLGELSGAITIEHHVQEI